MITAITVRNYKCLRDVSVKLAPVQILVGPNASGKSTLLDALSFLKAFLSDGLQMAMRERSQNPADLLWQRKPGTFSIEIDADVPSEIQAKHIRSVRTVRYSVAIRVDDRWRSHTPADFRRGNGVRLGNLA